MGAEKVQPAGGDDDDDLRAPIPRATGNRKHEEREGEERHILPHTDAAVEDVTTNREGEKED